MFRPTRVHIDTKAIQHNLQLLKDWNGGEAAFFCPMVKANAYGHGDVAVAQVVEDFGASAVGVALYEEGIALREARIALPILVFAPLDATAVEATLTHRLTPVVTRLQDLQAFAKVPLKAPLKIHLKFNTGMNRLGFDPGEVAELEATLKKNPFLQVEGVCTHLSHGEETHLPDGPSQRQLKRLDEMSRAFPGVRHAHKSASLVALAENKIPKDARVGARPGISLYGLPQDGHRTGAGLKPALRWSSELLRAHSVEKGEAVGYGARWSAPRKSVIGVLPVGYGDGYMRALSNKGEMLFRGKRVPVVGSVCMDYTLLDLTEAAMDGLPTPGEEVVILGKQGGAEVAAADLAQKANTIAYEIVTSIHKRVAREVL